eukprot:4996804-Pyramimonas_sp.AAC.1
MAARGERWRDYGRVWAANGHTRACSRRLGDAQRAACEQGSLAGRRPATGGSRCVSTAKAALMAAGVCTRLL